MYHFLRLNVIPPNNVPAPRRRDTATGARPCVVTSSLSRCTHRTRAAASVHSRTPASAGFFTQLRERVAGCTEIAANEPAISRADLHSITANRQ